MASRIALTAGAAAVGVRFDAACGSGCRRAQATMKPKNQRLVLVAAAMVAVLVAVLLAMWGLRDRASYFYTPAEIAAGKAAEGRPFASAEWSRRDRSSRRLTASRSAFVVTDGEGRDASHVSRDRARPVPGRQRRRRRRALKDGTFIADTILAKHDERYMPPELGNLVAEHKAGKTLER